MLRIVLTLLAAVLLCTPAKAEQIAVYDVISAKERLSDGLPFSSSGWAELSQSVGVSGCYSCYGRFLPMSTDKLRTAKHVVFEFGFWDNTGTTQVRLVSFYNDASGNRAYDRTWPIVLKNACCNPSAVYADVTAQWNSYFAALPVMTGLNGPMFLVEVNGGGTILMARIIVDY